METEIIYEYEYDNRNLEEEKQTIEEVDEEFENAVNTLMSLERDDKDEPLLKKARKEQNSNLSDREIIHTMMGCRHCRSRFGHSEDLSIHHRINEIFDKMKQTVK